MAEKRYYWLKLKEDYFNSPKIKKLRKLAGGDTMTIIYLKLQLLTLQNGGIYRFERVEDTIAEELALVLDEDVGNVDMTLSYFAAQNLIVTTDNENEIALLEVVENTGSEQASAERVRKMRERQAVKEAKPNALRQRQYRAKEICKQVQHIPQIEDYANNKRYNGNYYIVFKRDEMKCAICGSIENLCVHHIDGYDENKPHNSDENKMITLCRECHGKVHSGSVDIPMSKLESIGYFDECNESNEICNASVTACNGSVTQPLISNSLSNIYISSNKDTKSTDSIKPATKHKAYGEYKKVLLTDKQYEELVAKYGEEKLLKAITKVDLYCASKGKAYKNYKAVIEKWGIEENAQQQEQKSKLATYDWNF